MCEPEVLVTFLNSEDNTTPRHNREVLADGSQNVPGFGEQR